MSFAQAGGEMGASMGSMAALGIGALTGWGKPQGVSRKNTAKYIGNTFMGSAAGGLKTYFDEKRAKNEGVGFTVEASPERQGLITGLRDVYSGAANDFGALRGEVAPGYGRLTNAAVESIRGAEQRGRSDLASMFARRRIAGSSFAADKANQLAMESGKTERQARAESFLQEMQMTVDLIQRQTAFEAQSFQTALSEMNLHAALTQPIVAQMNNITSAFTAAMTQMGIDYQQQMYKQFTWASTTGGAGMGRMGGAAADSAVSMYGGGMR